MPASPVAPRCAVEGGREATEGVTRDPVPYPGVDIVNIFRVLTVGAAVALAATSALSQPVQAATDAAAAAGVSSPDTCRRSATRHDHGADRGMPTPQSSACAGGTARAAVPAARAKPGPMHDHGKVHKNQ